MAVPGRQVPDKLPLTSWRPSCSRSTPTSATSRPTSSRSTPTRTAWPCAVRRSTRGAAASRTTSARSLGRRRAAVTQVARDGDACGTGSTSPRTCPARGPGSSGVARLGATAPLMRTHTALHILCGVIWNEWGRAGDRRQHGPWQARMDFEFDPLPDGVRRSRSRPGQRGDRGRPPDRGVVPAARHRRRGRRPDPHQGQPHPRVESTEIRVVDIVGLDKQADGGTHVSRPARSAASRWSKTESKGKGNKRVRLEVHEPSQV